MSFSLLQNMRIFPLLSGGGYKPEPFGLHTRFPKTGCLHELPLWPLEFFLYDILHPHIVAQIQMIFEVFTKENSILQGGPLGPVSCRWAWFSCKGTSIHGSPPFKSLSSNPTICPKVAGTCNWQGHLTAVNSSHKSSMKFFPSTRLI